MKSNTSYKLIIAPCQEVDYNPWSSGSCTGCEFDEVDEEGVMQCTISKEPSLDELACFDKKTGKHYIWVEGD